MHNDLQNAGRECKPTDHVQYHVPMLSRQINHEISASDYLCVQVHHRQKSLMVLMVKVYLTHLLGHMKYFVSSVVAHVLWVILDGEFDGNIQFNISLKFRSKSGHDQLK